MQGASRKVADSDMYFESFMFEFLGRGKTALSQVADTSQSGLRLMQKAAALP